MIFSQDIPYTALSVETAGTSIVVQRQPNGLVLTNPYRIGDWQAVLRSLKIGDLDDFVGQTLHAQVTLVDSGEVAVSNVTVQYPIAPTVQIGGVSVGTGYQTSYYLGGSPVGIVAPDFSIDATPFDGLDGAVVSVDLPGSPSTELSVDTSGTNLSASYFGSGLYLVGHDTAEHYEQVLRSILFTPSLTQPGITRQVALTLDAGGHASPPVTTLVTVLSPPAPLVDLNGPAPGRNYAGTVEVGGPATEIVAADALSIDSPVWNVLSGAHVHVPDGAPGMLIVDTTGTNIVATPQGSGFELSGVDSVANYEAVLRTVRAAEPWGDPGYTRLVQFTVTTAAGGTSPPVTSPPATSRITVVAPQPPVVDINGDPPGSTQAEYGVAYGPLAYIAKEVTIHSSETLLYARIVFDPQRVPDYEFDTSGTNISVSIDSSSFLLTGADTAEHYQAVLRSARVGYVIGAAGDISSFEITVTSAAGTSASVNSLVTTVLLPPPTIDLNGSEPGINVETTVYAYRARRISRYLVTTHSRSIPLTATTSLVRKCISTPTLET